MRPIPPPDPAEPRPSGPPNPRTLSQEREGDASTIAALSRALPPGRSLAEELRRAEAAGLALLGPASGDYPAELRTIPRPPPFLYLRGAGGGSPPAVALVGSRRASAAGERLAHRLGRELADAGWRVVSGLARGIDRAALEGAAHAGGAPWAVLGNGLPSIYPPEHRELADRLVDGGGALLSELPCDAPPRREHFPRRNRIISGLSRGVVVIEATERSGSLITAGWALEQGREVLAVPGPAEGPGHQGCHRLIREGATLVTSAEEVIAALSPVPPLTDRVPESLRRAFAEGERDLGVLLELTGLPPALLLQGWRLLLERESGCFGDGEPPPPAPPPPDGSRLPS